jgi:perosamine synthetase
MAKLALFGGNPAVTSSLQPYRTTGVEEEQAVLRVMRDGTLSAFLGAWAPEYWGGPEVKAFEAEWAEAFKIQHAISVNSATSGLIAALGAAGIGPGDEVIVPPYTMSATAVAPLFYGGIPVFADVEPEYFCLDPKRVAEVITPKTRAIIAVNLFGQPADLSALRELADQHGLCLIEDNAQAPFATQIGRYTGTIGHIGVFSLNYHKHIHTGEGGVCVTDDATLSARLGMIRNHAENASEHLGEGDFTNLIGHNFRMTELSAAIGREQLKKAKDLTAKRIEIAERLSSGLKGMEGLCPPKVRADSRHVYYLWGARYDAKAMGVPRDVFAKALTAEGVPNSTGYVQPLYMLPPFQKRIAIGREGFPFNLTDRTYPPGLCPVTERLYELEMLIFLVCSYDPTESQVDQIVTAFHKVYDSRQQLAHVSAPAA